ncbi:MAG: vWA domain-containing protein [Dehalococcoidia bacterium]
MSSTASKVTTAVPRRLWRRLRSEECGAAFVLTGLSMLALAAMAALSLDVGRYMEMRRQLQNAADAAVHAAAQEMPDTGLAQDKAIEYFNYNDPTLGNSSINITFPDSSKVRIEAQADVGFLFAPLLGIDSETASVTSEAGAQMTDIMVVLDRSGSMCRDTHGLMLNCPNGQAWEPFNSVQDAATDFAGFFTPPYHELGVASYSTSSTLDADLSASFGAGSNYEDAIDDMVPAGYTCIGCGIREARLHLENDGRPETLKVIVLLSDGVANITSTGSNCGNNGCAQAANFGRNQAQLAADAGMRIYTIGLGDSVDGTLLGDIASIGGGAYVYAPSAAELADTFETIADLVRVQILE